MQLVKVWNQEIKGRLWTCGDIHGCYSLLMNTLSQVGFDFDIGSCFVGRLAVLDVNGLGL